MASNVAIAFALTVMAGGCTCLGAFLAFFAKLTNRRFLAASLSGAAGVMIYISLVEILPKKSVLDFAAYLNGAADDPRPFRYATFCFFAGLVAVYILDYFVHLMMHYGSKDIPSETQGSTVKHIAEVQIPDVEACKKDGIDGLAVVSEDVREANEIMALMSAEHRRALTKMGLLNLLAIGLHNLPEGLVTFVGYYHNPKAGVALAIAVALHNIPEGVVVGMPIYYATGSRMKAMLWTAVSGLFEIVGGIIGYIVVTHGSASPLANAIMFGVVSGIMVYISIKDLVPTALKYDPDNEITTNAFIIGAVVMAVSLIVVAI